MALTGTLKDFGIAEILQLIGQQAKSGVLHVEAEGAGKGEGVHVAIADGCVVSAEDAGREQKDRLGSMLVRAGLVSREDLERALEAQRRSLGRLGDVMVELRMVSKEDLRELTALQTTETIYRLFTWKAGTYRFEPGAVEWDASTATPLRAESLLMEGFRRIDEWPVVRRKITSPAMTFERRARLDDPARRAEVAALGPNERRVFALADPGRSVEQITDLSRLGEFETCKSLLTLVNLQLLSTIPPPRRSASAGVTAYARGWGERLRRGAAGMAATLALAAALAGAGWLVREREVALEAGGGPALRDGSAQRFFARYQLARITAALEAWRLEHDDYPASLALLVEAGLLRRADLRYPYPEDYYYRRRGGGSFVLLPPLP